MRVLHVVPSANRAIGGPALSVTGLAAAQAACGAEVTLASLDYREHGDVPPVGGARLEVVAPSRLGKFLRGWSPAFERRLGAVAARGVDIVHVHALWMWSGVYAHRLALRLGVPAVLSPRGMLDGWSLGNSARAKFLALAAYERANIRAAKVLHATSELEARAFRDFGCGQPIAVIPNGIPAASARGNRLLLEHRFPSLANKRWLLFLGRLHPKKGLPMLLEAWAGIAQSRGDWHLVIAGPDLTGHSAQLRELAASLPQLAERVTFTGMLDGELKAAALGGSELMVLPTLSENFGVAVAEGLAAGLPVITTRAAPWQSLLEFDCGWWVEPDADALRRALFEATGSDRASLAARGSRAQALAARFAWPAIAAQMLDVYRWAREGGSPPACVVTS